MLVHGTTLGLNAILERKGACTGIITNEGFRDLFEIGRADVPREHMYDFAYQRPAPLVKRRHRIGVRGRIDAAGKVVVPLDERALRDAASQLVRMACRPIAIAFLHSYRNPEHEERAARDHQRRLSRTSRCQLPAPSRASIGRWSERRRRCSMPASVPSSASILASCEARWRMPGLRGRFLVMRSGGGAMLADVAARVPIYTVMSGPAGGIMGASRLAQELDRPRLLTLDYGGTSLDAAVIENAEPLVMYEAQSRALPGADADFRYPLHRCRRRLDCLGAGRSAAGRAAERRCSARSARLRQGRHRAHDHRCGSGLGLYRCGAVSVRRHASGYRGEP